MVELLPAFHETVGAADRIGPQLGFSPTTDTLLMIGYNVVGFRDRDFAGARTTDKGLFAAIKLKFDADTFSFLGLRK